MIIVARSLIAYIIPALISTIAACGGRSDLSVVDDGGAPTVAASSGAGPAVGACPSTCTASKNACHGCVDGTCVYAPLADGTPCDDGDPCTTDDACVAGVCVGTPQACPSPSCQDGIRNGDETDVDCGGPTCARCAYGQLCHDDDDCEVGACMIVAGPLPVCAPLCHYAPCAGCCCLTHGTVQPNDYACMAPSACLAAGGFCI